MSYKAEIEFRAYEDDFNEGEGDQLSGWYDTLTAETQSELRNMILEATHSKWEDLDDEQINEYDFATEYSTSYLAIEEHDIDLVPASDYEVDQWKKGEEKLYAVHCHILVTEITERKATL